MPKCQAGDDTGPYAGIAYRIVHLNMSSVFASCERSWNAMCGQGPYLTDSGSAASRREER